MELISIADVRTAAANLAGVAVRTPLLPVPWAVRDASTLWIKPENLQPVGAFKLRGAYNAVANLSDENRRAGVVTHSSGNHGRALAYAAREFGIPVVIVMPKTAPAVKIAAVEALGAEVVLVAPADRLARAQEICAARGMTMIPPFDHPDVIAGQGTVGLEIIEDAPDVDVVIVPVGGGGLASGVATAIKALRPATVVIGVEPEDAAETQDSLRAGELRSRPIEQLYRTMADGVRVSPSDLTFAHIQARLDDIATVTEDQIAATVGLLARESNLVAEPSGGLSIAAYLFAGSSLPPGKTVAVISGGNIDPHVLADLITQGI
jgi:threonine dehydratase